MKRVIAAFLALVLLISVVPGEVAASIFSINSNLTDTWDGNAAASFASGSGTKEDPYVVTTAEQLAYFAVAVNNGKITSQHVILANNIDLTGHSWTPIGSTSDRIFGGTFDGKGYHIGGLQISTTVSGVAGLFGYVSGTIQNVNVTIGSFDVTYGGHITAGGIAACNLGDINFATVSGDIKTTNNSNTAGYIYVGGITGRNMGGSVTNSSYTSSGSMAAVSHGGYYAGGIAGENTGTITACHTDGWISSGKTATSGSYTYCVAGGIAGANSSKINACYSSMLVHSIVHYTNSMAIAGGLVGEATSDAASVNNSYATGDVVANSAGGVGAAGGGLVGYGRGSINYCFASNQITALTDNKVAAECGRLYGGNSCSINKSYYNSAKSLVRTESYTEKETQGSGCDAQEVTVTKYRQTTSPSNTGYTGAAAYSPSLITSTLGWGIYQKGDVDKTTNYWIAESSRPYLYTERLYSLTINYHKVTPAGNTVDNVVCLWKDAGSQYAVQTPTKAGYTPDHTVVSGTINEKTILDVLYGQNITLRVEKKSVDGKDLGVYEAACGYGENYEVTVPDEIGYTKKEAVLTGVMDTEGKTVTAYYEPNVYTLTVNYIYADTGEKAADSQVVEVKYGFPYDVTSPTILGYSPKEDVVTGTMGASDQTVTIEYSTNTYEIRVVYQKADGTVIDTKQQNITFGKEFCFETPEREGYTVDYTQISGVVTGNATYTVTYTPEKYVLSIMYMDKKTGEALSPYCWYVIDCDAPYYFPSPVIEGYIADQEVVEGVMPACSMCITVSYGKEMYPVQIRYQYSDGTLIRENTTNVEYGEYYSIPSPTIQYYTPDKAYVTGIMPNQLVTETVTYHKDIVAGGTGSCGAQAQWTLYKDGSLVISGQGDMENYEAGKAPWYALSSKISSVVIEEGITSIGDHAFYQCYYISSVSMPESLCRIGKKAFCACSSLYDITISENISKIDDGAFAGVGFNTIEIAPGNPHFVAEGRVLFTAGKETLLAYSVQNYDQSYEIPVGVMNVAPYAFYGNYFLKTLTVPQSVENIGQGAFENCSGLRNVQICSETVNIGANAFRNTQLSVLIVDGDILNLGDNAFDSASVRSVYFKGNAPQTTGENIFGTSAAVVERLCIYYPLSNETWTPFITGVSDENGYKTEYWQGYHAYAFNGVTDVTLTTAGGEKVYAAFVYCDKTPVEGVAVTFGHETKYTDANGFVNFVYTNLEQTVLQIHKDRYISGYEVSTAYTLKPIGVDYFYLNTSCSVYGETCYGNDIVSGVGYINVKYEGMIPILVKGNTEFDIVKMELVQEVKDAKNESGTYILKILQTVYQGDSNMDSEGYCRFLVAASAFSYSPDEKYPIYVRMYTTRSEKPVVQQLRIETNSFKFTGDFSNLLDDVELSLSDTGVPFLDGIKLKIKTPADCPLSFKVINNEVYVTWDLDNFLEDEMSKVQTETEDGSTSNLKKDFEDSETRAKNYMTKMSYKADEKLNKFKRLKFKNTPDFSIETSLAGGFCITLGQKNDVQKIQSYLKLALELKASWTVDFLLVFLPLTLEVKANASGEVEIKGFGYDFQNCKVLLPEITLNSEFALQVSLGLGVRAISAGGFGRVKLTTTVVIGETTYFDGMYLNGEYGLYFKLDIGLWGIYLEKAWQFMNWEIIPPINKKYTQATRSNGEETYEYIPMYELSAYKLQNRSVHVEDVEWVTDLSQDITQNSYEYAKPQLINHNGKTMMVYMELCEDRSDYNAQGIAYRIYDEAADEWSDPIYVCDNGTSDSTFDLVEYNGELYIIYTEADRVFTDADVAGKTDQQVMMETSMAQEVMVGKYNAEENRFEDFRNISNNAFADASPVIEVINGKLYAAWSSNRVMEESMVFGMNSANDVYISSFNGKTWTEPQCIVSNCNPVAEMELVALDGVANVAMIIDEDASYYTNTDRNIYIASEDGDVVFLDCYGTGLGSLETCIYQGKQVLTWDCAGGIQMLASAKAAPTVLVEAGSGITSDYRLENLSEDILALTWNVKNVMEDGQEIEKSVVYKKLLDDTNQWTETSVAFEAPYYMMNYDLVGYNGDMRFVYTNTNITIGADGSMVMNSKLSYNFQTTGWNLEVGEVSNAVADMEKGTVSMDVELTNNGVKTVERVSVIIAQRDAQSNKIQKYYGVGLYTVHLVSDQKKTVHFEADIIENIDLQYADIIIAPFDDTESYFHIYVALLNDSLSWNGSGGDVTASGGVGGSIGGGNIHVIVGGGSMSMASQKQDLSVEGEYLVVGGTEYLSLKVTNLGNMNADGMLNVAKLSEDGSQIIESIYTANILALPENGIKYYLVELKKDYTGVVEESFRCWISHFMGEDAEENNTVTITAVRMEDAVGMELDNSAVASELSSYHEVFDKYSSGDLELEITLNENQFAGSKDEKVNEQAVYVSNAEGTVLNMTVSKEYLKTMENGFYEWVFLFLTECGYIDCVLNLTVQDTTPIDLLGSISIVGEPKRGERLQIDTSQLNTDEITYAWSVDGEVISTEEEYIIESDVLGKVLTATVSGRGLYQGSVSACVYVEKVERSVNQPTVVELEEDVKVQLKKSFVVGDGTVEYGWAAENDPSLVTNWSKDNTFTFPEEGKYYLFVRVSGSDIYQDAVSEAVVYENKRVEMQITAVTLRPSCAGLYFEASFHINSQVPVVSKGIAVSLSNPLPVADGSDPGSLWAEGTSSVLIANVLSDQKTIAQNAQRAGMAVYARAYVLLADGTYLYSDAVSMDLHQIVKIVDTMWLDLSVTQQNAIMAMYDKFKDVLDPWQLTNIVR